MRLPSSDFFHAFMLLKDCPAHCRTQRDAGHPKQVQAIGANRPHRLAGHIMEVRMVMWIMSVHDALK